jgi:hypothetical protein
MKDVAANGDEGMDDGSQTRKKESRRQRSLFGLEDDVDVTI